MAIDMDLCGATGRQHPRCGIPRAGGSYPSYGCGGAEQTAAKPHDRQLQVAHTAIVGGVWPAEGWPLNLMRCAEGGPASVCHLCALHGEHGRCQACVKVLAKHGRSWLQSRIEIFPPVQGDAGAAKAHHSHTTPMGLAENCSQSSTLLPMGAESLLGARCA